MAEATGGFDPGKEGCRGFAEVSANFQQCTERTENFGVGFNTGEGIGDEFGERMRCGGRYFLDNGRKKSIGD